MSDLDFLEDRATQWPGTEFSRDVLDLIQRLREANGWKDEALKLRTDALALDKRLREAEADHHTLIEVLTARNARIAQLERVREAAIKLLEIEFFSGSDFGQLNDLRAALAAVEEPVKL